ncbi:hypothetical protein BJ875DRAFT_436426 [Amylocarpus encephaloides]|uniref:Uncharacterized protein n=1 Tax=Amylocarpus encephaloides TaxID=45428 RepID=A0A9P7YTE7_9HELO|nr:hypothetical protein BJ875DRAFT_436426 [Amylocarpus encephaloides]
MEHLNTNSYIDGQFQGKRFTAVEGASTMQVLCCAMLTLLFAEEFYEHIPRYRSFKFFAPLDQTFNELIYIEDEDLAQFNLQDIPGVHQLRVQVSTQRSASQYPEEVAPKFNVFMITKLLDSKGELMKDANDELLTSDIFLQFQMDMRRPELIKRLESWGEVVGLLRSAAKYAWEDNGKFKNVKSFVHRRVGKLNVDYNCGKERAKGIDKVSTRLGHVRGAS